MTPIQLVYKEFDSFCNITKMSQLYTKFVGENHYMNPDYSTSWSNKQPIIKPYPLTAIDGMSTDMCHLNASKQHHKLFMQRNLIEHPVAAYTKLLQNLGLKKP